METKVKRVKFENGDSQVVWVRRGEKEVAAGQSRSVHSFSPFVWEGATSCRGSKCSFLVRAGRSVRSNPGEATQMGHSVTSESRINAPDWPGGVHDGKPGPHTGVHPRTPLALSVGMHRCRFSMLHLSPSIP